MKILQRKLRILSNKKISGNYCKIILKDEIMTSSSCPGQFIEVKINNTTVPLLRRPFSIHRVRSKELGARSLIEVLYEVKGKGTKELSDKKSGEYLDVIGPLGNGFDLETPNSELRTPILIAGGMGVAPLVFVAETLKKFHPHNCQLPTVLIGARTKEQILCQKEFKHLGFNVKIATDDGSLGFKGRVTDLLEDLLSAISHQPSAIYACGPRQMLKELSRIAKVNNISAQISLEEHMACGIGACLGCVVKTASGYKRVCKEGPVFDAREIIW
jgi:dihydroorotate dehydrogenase electron transfer subunit